MLAIVLGSGLSSFKDYFEIVKSESFDTILDVPFERLDGHERKFIWCKYDSEIFLIISGKFHFYEGYSFWQLISPLKYAIDKLGVDKVIVTSASGGLSQKVDAGSWAYLKYLVCIPEVNIEMDRRYYRNQHVVNDSKAAIVFASFPHVTYAYHQGPSLGSLAEYKLLNKLGADLVGMSMFPEYCYLKSLSVEYHFLSIPVCNYFPFEELIEPGFEEVIEISSASIPVLVQIFKTFITPKSK